MSKLHIRWSIAGVCAASVLMFAACGDTGLDTDTRGAVVENLEENIKFEIRKEEPDRMNNQDEIGKTVQELHLLVAIDNSGSMGPSGRVIHDTIEMISALVEKELPISDVEYMLFNVDGAVFAPRDELFPIMYNGETSIYIGMEKINAWIKEHVQSDKGKEIRPALILFSDMYSSRTKMKQRYNENTAREEQEMINRWAENWNALAEEGNIDICIIQWESMADGESRDWTLDQELVSYDMGFQVQMEPLRKYILDLGDVKLEENNQNVKIEQDVVGGCLERVLEVITGVSGQKWRDIGEITEWRNSMAITVKKGYRLIVRIDSKKPDSNELEFYDLKTKQEYSVERIFEGEITDVYITGDVPVDKLEIRASNPELQHVYYLTIPQISMEAEFEKRSGRIEVGEDIIINIIAKCEEGDIRWGDTDLPLDIYVEIEDIDQYCTVYEKSLSAYPGDKLILTASSVGNYRIIIYGIDMSGNKEEIGRTILNVK